MVINASIVYSIPTSPWASALPLVPKLGPDKVRFTVDLRPVNRFTEKYEPSMPNIEQDLAKVSGLRFYVTFDFNHGYWQMSLHKDSQVSQYFIILSRRMVSTHLQAYCMAQLLPSCISGRLSKMRFPPV